MEQNEAEAPEQKQAGLVKADQRDISRVEEDKYCAALGMNNPGVSRELIAKTAMSMVLTPGTLKEEIDGYMDTVVLFLREIAPKDPFEAMLACRMISLHYMGMNELGKAAMSQSMDASNQHTSRAAKLLRVWNEAKDRFDRHRKGADQKVVVEHVHVNEGGQAIVGNVTHSGGVPKNQGGNS